MVETRQELVEKVLDKYSAWYDMTNFDEADSPLIAMAAFHEHGTGYMLVRKAEMWSADRHEYAFFFNVPHLTKEIYDQCIAELLKRGEPLVDPVEGHMCTTLVGVFFCDEADEDAVKALKSCHIRKSFQFSLKGWMEVHTAVAELGKRSVTANGAGRNTANFLKSIFSPKKRRRNLLENIIRSVRKK